MIQQLIKDPSRPQPLRDEARAIKKVQSPTPPPILFFKSLIFSGLQSWGDQASRSSKPVIIKQSPISPTVQSSQDESQVIAPVITASTGERSSSQLDTLTPQSNNPTVEKLPTANGKPPADTKPPKETPEKKLVTATAALPTTDSSKPPPVKTSTPSSAPPKKDSEGSSKKEAARPPKSPTRDKQPTPKKEDDASKSIKTKLKPLGDITKPTKATVTVPPSVLGSSKSLVKKEVAIAKVQAINDDDDADAVRTAIMKVQILSSVPQFVVSINLSLT